MDGYDRDGRENEVAVVKKTNVISGDGQTDYRKETVAEILQLPCDSWPERGISQATMERFGCRIKYSESDRSIESVYFPAYNAKGTKVIGYQKKALNVEKEEPGHFTAIGSVRVTSQLYGQKQADPGRKVLFLAEGWVDLMSIYQSMKQASAGSKWADLDPAVVSIVNGTSNAARSIASNDSFVRDYDQVCLCFDNDSRTEFDKKSIIKGIEATEEVGSYLSSDNVFTIPWPTDVNDANEMMMTKGYKALNDILAFKKKPYQANDIVNFSDIISFEEFCQPVSEGIYIPAFPDLMQKLKGFRLREMTTLTSFSGTGKSTIGAEALYHIAEQGHRVGTVMLEENLRKTMGRFVARRLGVHPNVWKFNMYAGGHSVEQIKDAYDWVNEMFIPLNHFGSLGCKELLSKVKALFHVNGCKYILLDHLGLAISGMGVKDERKDLDDTMTMLSSFVSANDLHLIVVNHLNRNASAGKREILTEPKFRNVHMEDLRGSSALEGLSWNVIGIDKEDMPDGTRGRIRIRVLKNREADLLGVADTLIMDEKSGLFLNAVDDVWTPPTVGY